MCNILKILKEKDKIIQDITSVSAISGAAIERVEVEMRDISARANYNIQVLSQLL